MFEINLVSRDFRVRHYAVVPAGTDGWEVTIEEGAQVERHEMQADWHRVERTLDRVRREVDDLVARGWTVRPVSR